MRDESGRFDAAVADLLRQRGNGQSQYDLIAVLQRWRKYQESEILTPPQEILDECLALVRAGEIHHPVSRWYTESA